MLENLKAKKKKLANKDILKNKKGITLIALVITIIVLLILAGVSIATLTGNNGLLSKANDAKTKTLVGQVEEEIRLAYNSVQTDSHVQGWDINKKAEELQKELREQDPSATVTVDGTNLKVSYKNYETTINADGTIAELAKSKIIINEFSIAGTRVEPTLPTGEFYYVGGTVDSGYVISDNIADKNRYAGQEDVGKDLVGSQFVWVPVDKDQKITISVTSEEEITSIVLTDPYGYDLTIPTASGKEYNQQIEPTINGPYRLVVTTASGEKKSFLNVHSLYAVDSMGDWHATEEYAKSQWYPSKGRNYADLQEMLDVWYGEGATVEDALMDGEWMKEYKEPEDDIDYATRVKNNGGFYIGRYEASYEGENAVTKVSTVANISSTLEDGKLWNYISQTDALSKAKGYNTSINSSLLTGAAWDRTLGWLYETGEKSAVEIVVDSTNWGNYSNDTFSDTTSLINTGEYEETKANNIYDLAGNLGEWTTEAYSTDLRVDRGGSYSYDGSYLPASRRDGTPFNTHDDLGLRVALYM